MLHQSAAAVFFAAAIAHMALWIRLCVTAPPASPLSYRVGWRSALFKGACAVTSVFPLPAAFLLHPASPARRVLSLSEADAGGLQQYCLVLCVASFFASYSVELSRGQIIAQVEECAQLSVSGWQAGLERHARARPGARAAILDREASICNRELAADPTPPCGRPPEAR